MKKFLFISVIFLSMPVFAVCPLNPDGSVCSLPDKQTLVPFEANNHSFSEAQKTQLSMPDNHADFGQLQSPKGLQMQGSLSCKFGNCTQNSGTDFLSD